MSRLHLELLGGFQARFDSGEPLSIPSRKSQALLAYLAVGHGRSHPRERLMALLWSSRAEEQARNSLRQCLSTLRKNLGDDDCPLVVTRHNVNFATQRADVDVVAFEGLLEDGSDSALERAVSLYQGEFLDGLVTRDPACDEWVAEERSRLQRLALDSLDELAARKERSGDAVTATELARRIIAVDPLREPAHRALMRLHAHCGDRSEALRAYRVCCDILMQELGIEPEADTRELYEAIRDGTFELSVADDARLVERISATPSPPESEAISSLSGIPELVPPDKPSVVVLPFLSLGTSSDEDWFADGVTQDVIDGLSCYRDLMVIAGFSSFTYRDRTDTDPARFATDLGVRYVVQGRARRSGHRLRVAVQLTEAASGRVLWSERIERTTADLFEIEDEITGTIVSTLVEHIEDVGARRSAHKRPEEQSAHDCLLQGRRYRESYDAGELATARRMLEQAISIEPEYAAAYANLALVHYQHVYAGFSDAPQQALQAVLSLAEKALALDEYDAEAHLALAVAHLYFHHYELARTHFDRSQALNPNLYDAYCLKSWLLTMLGETAEAMSCGATAYRLNPLDTDGCLWSFALSHYLEGRYRQALAVFDQFSELDASARACRAACLAQLGESAQAASDVAAALAQNPQLCCHDWDFDTPFKNKDHRDHLYDGLRKAGVPLDADRQPPLELPDKPSIAVLPFTNMSGDPKQEYFSDGVAEDIITELSRLSTLLVIARNSCFQYRGGSVDTKQVGRELGVHYVLEGSVRRGGDRVRVNVQLIDALKGSHIWANRYDRTLEDVFAVQDEIVDVVVSTVAGQVTAAETARRKDRPTKSLSAYDCYLRGLQDSHYGSYASDMLDRFSRAKTYFDKAVALDPGYTDALAELAFVHIWLSYYGSTSPGSMEQAGDFAERAVMLDSGNATAHAALGMYLHDSGNHDRAAHHFEQAMKLNPNNTRILGQYSMFLGNTGQTDEAVALSQSAIRRDPYHPEWLYDALGEIYWLGGRYEESIAAYDKLMAIPFWVHCDLACCYAYLGRDEEAQAHAHAFRNGLPAGWSIEDEVAWGQRRLRNAANKKHHLEGWRRAGLIE